MAIAKPPTWTHLVTEALKIADDFRSAQELMVLLGGNYGQISAALHHLQVCKVVDAVQGPGGLFWFYRGLDEDLRVREVKERRIEKKPRRARAVRKPQIN